MKPILLSVFIFLACVSEDPVSFSEKTLSAIFTAQDNTEIRFSEVLQQYKGETVLIDVWATWCKDCIVGMPKLEMLQTEFPTVQFVYLSLDRNRNSWKKGIEKYNLKGAHYYIASGWDGPFGEGIDLDWIPRYMVVNPEGEISVYRAIKADDKDMLKTLKMLTTK